jgi:hypothetical protein
VELNEIVSTLLREESLEGQVAREEGRRRLQQGVKLADGQAVPEAPSWEKALVSA